MRTARQLALRATHAVGMTPIALRSATLGLLVLGAVGTLALLVYAAGGVGHFVETGLVFALWALAPYVLLGFGTTRFWSRPARVAGLVGSAVVVVGALALYVDAVVVNTDSLGALAFAAVPLLQAAVALATIGTAFLLHRRAAR